MSLADGFMAMLKQIIHTSAFVLLGAVTTLSVAWSCAIWSDLDLQPYAVSQIELLASERQIHIMQKTGFGAKQHTIAEFMLYFDWVSGKTAEQRILEQRKLEEDFIAKGGVIVGGGVTSYGVSKWRYLSDDPFNVYWSKLGVQAHSDEDEAFVNQEFAAGWPMKAMWGSDGYIIRLPREDENDKCKWIDKYILQTENLLPTAIVNKYGNFDLPLKPITLGFAGNTVIYSCVWWIALVGIARARRRFRHVKGTCVKCAYDLRGITSERCPECGIVACSDL